MKLTRIDIKNFRSLVDVSVPLGPLNVLIGPNGSGKTAFLEVLEMLAAGAKGSLGKFFMKKGGLDAVMTQLKEISAEGFSVVLETEIESVNLLARAGKIGAGDTLSRIVKGTFHYQVEIARKANDWEVNKEILAFQANGNPSKVKTVPTDFQATLLERKDGSVSVGNGKNSGHPERKFSSHELTLSDAGRLGDAIERFQQGLAGIEYFGVVGTSHRDPIRLAQDLDPMPLYPSPDGDNLVSAIYNLKIHHPKSFERLINAVEICFPDCTGLDFPLMAVGRAGFRFNDRWSRNGYEPHQLSEGTLRLLWLFTLLLSPNPPGIILLDEPETSLHPQALMVLAEMLEDCALRAQVFVATHSDQLVRWLQPEHLVILDKEDGVTTARRGNDPGLNIQAWLEDYRLEELWLRGFIGGRL